jgi:hypothetical protein
MWRHAAGGHSLPLLMFLVLCTASRTQEGQQLESLWRLQSAEHLYHSRLLSCPSHPVFPSILWLLLLLQDWSGQSIPVHPSNVQKTVITTPFVLRPTQRHTNISALHGWHFAGTRLLLCLLGRHPRFLLVSQRARATSTDCLRPAPEVRNPNQPGELRLDPRLLLSVTKFPPSVPDHWASSLLPGGGGGDTFHWMILIMMIEVKIDQYCKFSYTYQDNSISKIIWQFPIRVIQKIDRAIALVVSHWLSTAAVSLSPGQVVSDLWWTKWH